MFADALLNSCRRRPEDLCPKQGAGASQRCALGQLERRSSGPAAWLRVVGKGGGG